MYAVSRVVLLGVPGPGPTAAGVTAVVATALDVVADPRGVRDGIWAYPESWLSSPRIRGVPWWNFAGWLFVVFVTAMLPAIFG